MHPITLVNAGGIVAVATGKKEPKVETKEQFTKIEEFLHKESTSRDFYI